MIAQQNSGPIRPCEQKSPDLFRLLGRQHRLASAHARVVHGQNGAPSRASPVNVNAGFVVAVNSDSWPLIAHRRMTLQPSLERGSLASPLIEVRQPARPQE